VRVRRRLRLSAAAPDSKERHASGESKARACARNKEDERSAVGKRFVELYPEIPTHRARVCSLCADRARVSANVNGAIGVSVTCAGHEITRAQLTFNSRAAVANNPADFLHFHTVTMDILTIA